jgi:hypothetical protein
VTTPRRLVTAETDRTCPPWCDPEQCTIYIAAAGGCHQSRSVPVFDDSGQRRASVFLRQFPHGHLQTVFAMRGDWLPPGTADRLATAIREVNALTGMSRAE